MSCQIWLVAKHSCFKPQFDEFLFTKFIELRFKGIGKKGKSIIGWFFGSKLHLIISERDSLLSVKLTTANTYDRTPVPDMVKNIFGKLFGDKGYLLKKIICKFARARHIFNNWYKKEHEKINYSL